MTIAKPGKIYFVSAPGRIKIGYTRQPEKRLSKLRHVDMEKLEVIDIIDGSRRGEKRLHKLVEKYRISGEWFTDCEPVRHVMTSALAGEIDLSDFEEHVPSNPSVSIDCLHQSATLYHEMVNEAIQECHRLGRLIDAKMIAGKHKETKELSDALLFLAGKIIAPYVNR